MDPDCPAIALTPDWKDDQVVLVGAVDAIRLCREGGYQALNSGKAIWALEGVRREIVREVRDFVARARLTGFALSSMDDSDVIKLIARNLKSRDLIALKKVGPSEAPSKTGDRAAKLRRLVREIESKTRGRLNYSGRQYKLVVDESLAKLPGRDSYQVARQDEARQVLDGLAKQPGTPADLHTLMGEAREAISTDWRPPLQPDGLVLLRKIVTLQASAPDTGPALTPSQLKKLTTKTDWIEVEVVDQDGEPYTGGYRLELANGTANEASFNEEGFFGDYDLDTGNCHLFLVDRKTPKGGAAEAPAADTTFASVKLVDRDGNFLGDYRYQFEFSDGTKKEGVSGEGEIRIQDIPSGECVFSILPDEEADA
jgi:hypothetical protein